MKRKRGPNKDKIGRNRRQFFEESIGVLISTEQILRWFVLTFGDSNYIGQWAGQNLEGITKLRISLKRQFEDERLNG